MRIIATIAFILIAAASWATKYTGWMGTVIVEKVEIDMNDWTGKFTGKVWSTPGGTPANIRGRIQGSRFKVENWFETTVVRTSQSIIGPGVFLVRK